MSHQTPLRLSLLFCLAFSCTGAVRAETAPCTPMLEIFQETLCVGAEEDARLPALVWDTALAKTFGAEAVTPAAAEIEAYRTALNRTMEQSYRADRETIGLLENAQERRRPDERTARELSSILDITRKSVRLYEERQRHDAAMPENYRFILSAAETEVIRATLSRWKKDEILYRRYGGRLAVTPDGAVAPIDAYREFLDFMKAQGNPVFVDPRAENVFAALEKSWPGEDKIVPPDDSLAQNYFSAPEWQLSLSNNDERIKSLEQWIDSLPRK